MSTIITSDLLSSYKSLCTDRFDDRELKRMHKAFYTACPSGKMDPNSFKEFIRNLGVFPYTTFSDTFPHLFRGYDVDRDGFISMNDFILYHTAVIHSDTDLLERIVFAIFDADQNGMISKEELAMVITQSTKLCGDADVTTSSVQMLIQQEAEQLLSFIDIDGDGLISVEDLHSIAQRHPETLEKLRNLA
eukprot:PhF_6_TR17405/c0_g1_i1/m.26643